MESLYTTIDGFETGDRRASEVPDAADRSVNSNNLLLSLHDLRQPNQELADSD